MTPIPTADSVAAAPLPHRSGPLPASAARADADAATQTPADPAVYLTFGIGGQFFALEVETVREILDEQPMAILPEAPPDVLGLIDLRGEGVPVMDVSRRLGVRADTGSARRIVVIEREGSASRLVGVIADQVLSVVEIAPDAIEPAPRIGPAGQHTGLLRGVARLNGRLVLLLDQTLLLGGGTEDLFDFGS